MSKYPKYLNKVMLTKQETGGHEFTVLYDRQGNKYLKLEPFDLDKSLKMPPEIEIAVDTHRGMTDLMAAKGIYGKAYEQYLII